MDEKKRRISILTAGISMLVIALVLLAAFSRHNVLIRDDAGSYFRARTFFIAGGLILCSRDRSGHAARAEALRSDRSDAGLTLISLKHVQLIELTDAHADDGTGLSEWKPGLRDYIGDFQLNAAGNRGYLSIRASGGTVYGTVRFPDWGRGATEYLKSMAIVNGRISFIRSATTRQELSRLGASSSFIQVYSGEYLRSGSLIRGFYTVQGQRKAWEAVRTR